ncbi:MAG: L-seryl-tRNA(Sec) selenium transferase [Clostridiales bacterium 38_11]|nr:MAG: L-seryl-tRNA(Sec) selenium transferase [Clostridiales bacterium 38_11]HBH12060.1 L-seryl-tRNA(Sec) selenium transferase [Clostridiales bacterium]
MDKNRFYRLIPKVDTIMEREAIQEFDNKLDRKHILSIIRQELEALRFFIEDTNDVDLIKHRIDIMECNIVSSLHKISQGNLKKVINCTGVIVHTNLGRSIISNEIFEEIKQKLIGYTNLEYDLESGTRGSRHSIVESLLCLLTGAESAMIVNNNAAAVMLALNTLSLNKDTIVSRGELVEIGGSFRIPEVMKMSGANLVEVGTTNKTRLSDYENAISENTGTIMKVHTSNYTIVGFSESVGIEELANLQDSKGIVLIEDLGSGTLVDFRPYGIAHEPTVKESVEKGIDIVTFSGDKLLGGPQAGLIVGKKYLIDKMKKNQLARVLRVDKFTLAALESILKVYLKEENAFNQIPTLHMITQKKEMIRVKAEALKVMLIEKGLKSRIRVIETESMIGGGSLPVALIPSYAVEIEPLICRISTFEKALRHAPIPIISRIENDKLILDLRTVSDDELGIIVNQLRDIVEKVME